jgi:DNA invertase Pin-like site-specific DNA recombinase
MQADFDARSRPPVTHIYGRASTAKQSESPETQKKIAAKYCEMMELPEPHTYYIDPATSAKTPWAQRLAGRELMTRLRPGDHVVITKLDRAFRRLSDCVLVLEKFERMGIKLHICNMMGGSVDLSSPMGKFMLHILAAFAELERAFISERTKDGIAAKKEKGQRHCRHAGYGFQWAVRWVGGRNVKTRVPNPDERRVMRSILTWRLQDEPLSWEEIESHLKNLGLATKDGKPWSKQRIRRAAHAEMKLQFVESKGLGTA